jgi:NADH:ubiquinone oxidoreductase subunit D
MQIRLELDGEVIVAADPQIGLLNRSVEKLFEALSVSRRQALLRQADVQGRLAAAVSEAGALADKVAELSVKYFKLLAK